MKAWELVVTVVNALLALSFLFCWFLYLQAAMDGPHVSGHIWLFNVLGGAIWLTLFLGCRFLAEDQSIQKASRPIGWSAGILATSVIVGPLIYPSMFG